MAVVHSGIQPRQGYDGAPCGGKWQGLTCINSIVVAIELGGTFDPDAWSLVVNVTAPDLRGSIAHSIGELTQLQTLNLGGTPRARGGFAAVSCPLRAWFGKFAYSVLDSGRCADLGGGLPLHGGTWLTGTIPESIGQLTQLQTLDFYGPPRGLGADLRLWVVH